MNHAKECNHWKVLLEIVPIPSFHICNECGDEYSNHEVEDGIMVCGNIRHPCEGPYFEDPRIHPTFKDLSPYSACQKLMPVAQSYVKNLLSFYDLNSYPEDFGLFRLSIYDNENGPQNTDLLASAYHTINVFFGRKYPKRWVLFHNIVSLHMAANDRDRGSEPQFFRSAFCGYEMDELVETSFGDEYLGYLSPDYRGFTSKLCSNNHLRSLLSETQEGWDRMTTVLGNKALAGTLDILYIVRGNLEELLLSHPGPPDV